VTSPPALAICLAIVTRGRPQPLGELLQALLQIERPAKSQLHFLVIDNDPKGSAETVFGEFAAKAIEPASYHVEAGHGIPLARNRALREAAKLRSDVLVFIDDDEIPALDWLANLVAHYRKTGGELIGGPVRMRTDSHPSLTAWQRVVYRSTVAWVNRKARKANRYSASGQVVTVVTNNWLGDMRFIAANDLRFEPGFAASGSSDTAFFRAAMQRGARHGWCPEAIVYDRPPLGRLSLRYQFRRARAQSINHFHQRHPDAGTAMRIRTAGVAVIRIVLGGVGMIIPFSGAASLVRGIRSIGWGVGRFDALAGKRSEFYSSADH
jgi:hypothetical protein